MQPQFRQTPPSVGASSTIAADSPSCAARMAAMYPPGPEPITTRSNDFIARSPSPSFFVGSCRLLERQKRTGTARSGDRFLDDRQREVVRLHVVRDAPPWSALDPLLQLQETIEDGLRPRGTAGNVDVHGDDRVDALNRGVVVVRPARAGARAERDDPLGLGHLVVDLLQDRRLAVADRADHHQEIGLARREARQRRAEAVEVVARARGRHELHAAARGHERVQEEAVLPPPVHDRVDGRGEERVLSLPQNLVALRHRLEHTVSAMLVPVRLVSAWLVHLYTASSAVFGVWAVVACFRGQFRLAMYLMMLTLVIDSTDGALARLVDVRGQIPWFDGRRLDDICDYFTYVVVPACFR